MAAIFSRTHTKASGRGMFDEQYPAVGKLQGFEKHATWHLQLEETLVLVSSIV